MIAYAINERMQRKLDYTQKEVRVLKDILVALTGSQRISFTADQRRRLAVAGKALSPEERKKYCQIVVENKDNGDRLITCFHCGYPEYTGGLVIGNYGEIEVWPYWEDRVLAPEPQIGRCTNQGASDESERSRAHGRDVALDSIGLRPEHPQAQCPDRKRRR
jgi:hypothetical protein